MKVPATVASGPFAYRRSDMIWTGRMSVVAGLAMLGVAGAASAQSDSASPTCSDTLGIAVHGQHIVGDYVTGVGSEDFDWPPGGSNIGTIVSDNGGAAVPGGPGPGF